MLEQDPKREKIEEQIALTPRERVNGEIRYPFIDAWKTLDAIRALQLEGGCAESSAAFVFGREYVENKDLMPDFSNGPVNESSRVIRVMDQMQLNFLELNSEKSGYLHTLKEHPPQTAKLTHELDAPRTMRFLACVSGDFWDRQTGMIIPMSHMIGGIRSDPRSFPEVLEGLRPSPGIAPPFWVWDTYDFKIRQDENTATPIVPRVVPYPSGLRLLSASQTLTLLNAYTYPNSPILLKLFYS